MNAAIATPVVLVVIVSCNVREHLLGALRALLASSGVTIESVGWTTLRATGSADAVEVEFPQTTVVCNDTNLGIGKASNCGLKRTRGQFVLLLNPDVMVEQGCLRALTDFRTMNPKAGATSPRLTRADGRLDLAALVVTTQR